MMKANQFNFTEILEWAKRSEKKLLKVISKGKQ